MQIASSSTAVKIHDLSSGEETYNYSPGGRGGGSASKSAASLSGIVRSLSWSRNGYWLAAASAGGDVDIISPNGDGQPHQQFHIAHTIQAVPHVTSVAFQSTTRKHLALAEHTGKVLIYNLKTGAVRKRFPRSHTPITHLEWLMNDSHLVAMCDSGEALLFSNTSDILSSKHRMLNDTTDIATLRCNSLQRSLVVGGSRQGTVAVWDIFTEAVHFSAAGHQKTAVTAVAFSTVHSDLVLSAGRDRQFAFYDVTAGKRITAVTVDNCVTAVDFSPNGLYIAMGTQKGLIIVYDSRSVRKPVHTIKAHPSTVHHLLFRSVTSDGCSDRDSSVDNLSACNLNRDVSCNKMARRSSTDSINRTTNDDHSFDLFVVDNPRNNNLESSVCAPGDSFMDAMGINSNNSTLAHQISRRLLATTDRSISCTPPTAAMKSQMASGANNELNTNPTTYSTPKTTTAEDGDGIVDTIPPGESPIVITHCRPQNSSATMTGHGGDQMLLKRDDLNAFSDDLKQQMCSIWSQNMASITEMYLNLQMTHVRESIKVENRFESLHAELTALSCTNGSNNGGQRTEDGLLMQNAELMKRVAFLQNEVDQLRLSLSSCTCNNST